MPANGSLELRAPSHELRTASRSDDLVGEDRAELAPVTRRLCPVSSSKRRTPSSARCRTRRDR